MKNILKTSALIRLKTTTTTATNTSNAVRFPQVNYVHYSSVKQQQQIINRIHHPLSSSSTSSLSSTTKQGNYSQHFLHRQSSSSSFHTWSQATRQQQQQVNNNNDNVNEDFEVMLKKIQMLEQKAEYANIEIKASGTVEQQLEHSSTLKAQSLYQELVLLYMKTQQFQKAESLIKDILIPSCVALYGPDHLQLSKLFYSLAHVQFFMHDHMQCLQSLFEVVRIRQAVFKSGVHEMKKQIIEATLAFNYVTFFSDFLLNDDIPYTEAEKIKLFNVYVGQKDGASSTTLAKLDVKQPLHKLALAFPEKSRFKLAQTILQGKLDKLEKNIQAATSSGSQSSTEQLQSLYELKYLLCSKLGTLYELQMRYKKSFDTFNEALDACSKVNGPDSVECCEIMVELASVLGKMRVSNDECVVLGKKAIVGLNKATKDLSEESPHLELKIAKALAALAQSKLSDQPKDALKLANQAAKIYERLHGRSSVGWISTAYIFAEAYDNLADTDSTAMPLATKMYDEIEEAIICSPTPSLLRLPLKSSPEFEDMLGDHIIDISARTYFPSALATHYINVGCRYVAYYMDTATAVEYMEKALKILDEEQSDDYFSLEREFTATQLASFYVISQQDAKMEKLRSVVMNRLKRVLGTKHPFYIDQQKHFANLRNTAEMSGKTMEERLAKMEELMKDADFENLMKETILKDLQELEEKAARGELDLDEQLAKEQEIKDLTEERLNELLNDQKKLHKVLGFEAPPLEQVLQAPEIPQSEKASKKSKK